MKKNRTGFFTLIFSIMICSFGAIMDGILREEQLSHFFKGKRHPASSTDCSDLVNETMLFLRPPPGIYLWKRLTETNFSLNDFSIERMNQLEAEYSRELEAAATQLRPEASAEGLLAFIRASHKKSGGSVEELTSVSLKQAKALHKVLKKLSMHKRLSLESIDDLTLELFTTAFGPREEFSSFFSFSKRQKDLLIELASVDIAKRGLLENFNYFRFLQGNPNLYRRFGQSRFSEGLKVGLLNLPILLGMPPLYLPKFRPPKMSLELSEELLAKGMTDEVYQKILAELGTRLVVQDKYQLIRKYYMYGVMIYLVMAQAHDTYLLSRDLESSNELIEEAQSEALEITGSIEVLERAGIDVFSDEEVEDGNIFCLNLKECFQAFSVSTDDTESEGYRTCQDVIDPGNQCTSL